MVSTEAVKAVSMTAMREQQYSTVQCDSVRAQRPVGEEEG